jgi:hypothetical protein
MSQASGSAGLAEAAGGAMMGVGLILIVGLVLGVWVVVKACNIIVRGFLTDGKKQVLWLLLLVFLGSGALLLVSVPLGATAVGLSFLALVIAAHCVEVYHKTTFQPLRGSLPEEILKKPWWETSASPTKPHGAAAV